MPRCKKMVLEQLEDTLLPSLKLKADPNKETDCLDSKFGGIFYLPQGESIPLGVKGTPMEFLVQLNFSKLNAPEGFPKKGILQFFLDTDVFAKSLMQSKDGIVEKDQYAVRYYENPDKELQQPIEEQEIVVSKYVVTAIIDPHNNARFEVQEGVEIPQQFQQSGEGFWHPWLRQEGHMSEGRYPMVRHKGKIRPFKKQEYASLQLNCTGEGKIELDSGYEDHSSKITPELVLRAGYNLGDCSGLDAFAYDFTNWGCKIGGHPAIRTKDGVLSTPNGKSIPHFCSSTTIRPKKRQKKIPSASSSSLRICRHANLMI